MLLRIILKAFLWMILIYISKQCNLLRGAESNTRTIWLRQLFDLMNYSFSNCSKKCWFLSIYKFCLSACFYQINAKTLEPIGHEYKLTPEKDHGTSKLEKKILDKSLNIFLKMRQFGKKSGKIWKWFKMADFLINS